MVERQLSRDYIIECVEAAQRAYLRVDGLVQPHSKSAAKKSLDEWLKRLQECEKQYHPAENSQLKALQKEIKELREEILDMKNMLKQKSAYR